MFTSRLPLLVYQHTYDEDEFCKPQIMSKYSERKIRVDYLIATNISIHLIQLLIRRMFIELMKKWICTLAILDTIMMNGSRDEFVNSKTEKWRYFLETSTPSLVCIVSRIKTSIHGGSTTTELLRDSYSKNLYSYRNCNLFLSVNSSISHYWLKTMPWRESG